MMNHSSSSRQIVSPALVAVVLAVTLPSLVDAADKQDPPGVIRAEFIFDEAPFPSCHASTIAQTDQGLVAAWFGGTREKHPDVGIWVARQSGKGWSAPVEVANGVQSADKRHPCWNPVLFQPTSGPLLLFYKVGPDPSNWWGMLIKSRDGGKSWSEPVRLPDGILGPIKNKPIQLGGKTILSGSSTEHAGWQVHMERSPDLGKTWTKIGPLNDGRGFHVIQPTILSYGKRLQILCRSRQKRIYESGSTDGGKTWTPLVPSNLPNPNAGFDAVTLADGRALLVYNHTMRGRSPLNVAVSSDGKQWQAAAVLEDQPGEYSYPAVIQTKDGLVHTTYTWKRTKIKHVVLDPKQFVLRDIPKRE